MKTFTYAICCLVAACLAAPAWAADVTLNTADGFGASSFNSAGGWSNGQAPSAGNAYIVPATTGIRLRTPADAGSYTFGGDSLKIQGGVSGSDTGFCYKGTDTAGTSQITVGNLILDGGQIVHINGNTMFFNLYGNLNVASASSIYARQGPIHVYSVISGSATITNPGADNATNILYIHSAANTFTGSIVNNGRFELADDGVLNFVIGANGVNNSVTGTGPSTVFNGDFVFDLAAAGTTVGDSWAIAAADTQTFGETFTVVGFTDLGDGTWATSANGAYYTFDEGTGTLAVTLPKPYDPVVEEQFPVGTVLPIKLMWKAAADPAGTYAVNPDIVKQQVFLATNPDQDPNLVFIGETGDPGTDVPDSEFTFNGAFDATYNWVVVEALDGFAQTFAVGDNLSLVDPNNIIGPTWSFASSPSSAQIVTQPVDQRVFATDSEAVFTVEFTSVQLAQATWYKDDVALTGTETDVTIVPTDTSSTLTIATPELADEGKYYCILSVAAGTDDDVQTATRMLIIKRELANFEFENSLADTNGNAPTGVVKTVSLTEPNEMLATVDTPTYVSGIDGLAISLNGTQFVDMGTDGYPKAGPLNTLGDIRGLGYEKQGFGRGMDQGSILCWVKPASTGAIMLNANAGFVDHFGLTMGSTNNARMIVRGQNWDDSYNGGSGAEGALNKPEFSLQDGYWHMIAATWDNDSGMKVYINGELVASAGNSDYTEKYLPWERANLLGAGRTGTRHILNNLLTGAIDSLRIYNYEITPDAIANEYLTQNELGYAPCLNHDFDGNAFNFDNTGSSYCIVDLADFIKLAEVWLNSGLYPSN